MSTLELDRSIGKTETQCSVEIFCVAKAPNTIVGHGKEQFSALHGEREREERNERCIRDVGTGWLGRGTETALFGSASSEPKLGVQNKSLLSFLNSHYRRK